MKIVHYFTKRIEILIIIIIIFIPSVLFLYTTIQSGTKQADKKVLAFYYNWYGNTSIYDGEPANVANQWLHWNENNHNPPTDLSANHTPVLGPFDSANNDTLATHLNWAMDSGIDGFICTWWGLDSDVNIKFEKSLRYTNEHNLNFTWTVYFESVQQRFKNGTEIYHHIKYIIENYGNDPKFLKQDGRPVIFLYATGYNGIQTWTEAINLLHKDGLNPYLVADLGSIRAPTQTEVNLFDGFHVYNPVGAIVSNEDYNSQYAELAYYSQINKRLSCYTVIPGYNDFNVCHCGATTGRNTYIEAPRRNGELYTEMWGRAIGSSADWILICTFNEWHEGSEIEPSVQFGSQYLTLTKQFTSEWKK
jgi:hypothetical protein